MIRRSLSQASLALLLGALALPAVAAAAGLSSADLKQIKKDLAGTLYLRVDAPVGTGSHPYGTYLRPLVEVTPKGINTDDEEVYTSGWWFSDATYWGVRVNDPVKFDDMDYDDEEDRLEIELEGIGQAEDEDTVLAFVGLHNLADWKAAFDLVLSKRPLQEDHDDWSAEIKAAIAKREIHEGMTKRQAFYVVGKPERFEKKTEKGKEVEIWHLRQSRGIKIGYWHAEVDAPTGAPRGLRFENGVLKAIFGSSSSDDDFSLD